MAIATRWIIEIWRATDLRALRDIQRTKLVGKTAQLRATAAEERRLCRAWCVVLNCTVATEINCLTKGAQTIDLDWVAKTA